MAIARTVAEAVVGDQLWIAPDYWRCHSSDLTTVIKVGRSYVTTTEKEGVTRDREWHRDSGAAKQDRSGFAPSSRAMGWYERESRELQTIAGLMGDKLNTMRHVVRIPDGMADKIRDIAHILGFEAPGDYSKPGQERDK